MYNAHISEKRFKNYTKDDEDQLILVLCEWRIYSGISDEVSPEEFKINAQFIRENFEYLNLTDIKIAKDLSTSGKLKIQKLGSDESFGRFSPTYIARILNAYEDYKRDIIYKVKQQIQKEESKKVVLPTPEEYLKIFKGKLVTAFTQKIKGIDFDDLGGSTYQFIVKNNLFEITPSIQKKANQYGLEKITIQIESEKRNAKIKRIKYVSPNVKFLKNKEAENYIVNEWLSQMIFMEENDKSIEIRYKELCDKLDCFLDSITYEMINFNNN